VTNKKLRLLEFAETYEKKHGNTSSVRNKATEHNMILDMREPEMGNEALREWFEHNFIGQDIEARPDNTKGITDLLS